MINVNTGVNTKINTKELVFKSKVKVPYNVFVMDNIVVKPRKNKTKGGYSYTFWPGWYTYAHLRVYVHPSFVKDGMVKFPIENARAFRIKNRIFIVPCDNYVVHYVGLRAISGFESHIYINGNSISVIGFSGYDTAYTHFSGAIFTSRKNSQVIIEYGLTHWLNFYSEWDSVKKIITL